MLAPATAERLASKMGLKGLSNGDLVELGLEGRKITGPLWVMPGHAKDSVTVYLGYGRKRAGRVGNDVGFNVYPLRASHAMTSGTNLLISRAGGKQMLATTQHHHAIDRGGEKVEEESVAAFERELVRVGNAWRNYQQRSEFCRGSGRGDLAGPDALSELRLQQRLSVGHDD